MVKKPVFVPPRWNPDNKLTLDAFKTSDEFGKMLRISFVLEEQLDHLILSLDVGIPKQMRFAQKCQILKALRFPAAFCNAIMVIKSVRNMFAHEKDASFEKKRTEIESILENHGVKHSKNFKEYRIRIDSSSYLVSEMCLGNQLLWLNEFLASIIGSAPDAFEFPGPQPKNDVNIVWE